MAEDFDKVALLERELDRLLKWVRAAESRLALVLPLSTAMLGALAVIAPKVSEWTIIPAIAASFAALFLALSVLCAAIATFPRTSGPKGSLIYFGGIVSHELDQYQSAMLSLSIDNYFRDLSAQCHRNAQIAQKKYYWVQRSMALLFISAAPWAISLALLYESR